MDLLKVGLVDCPEYVGSMFLRNAVIYQQAHTALQCRRTKSTYSQPSEPQTSYEAPQCAVHRYFCVFPKQSEISSKTSYSRGVSYLTTTKSQVGKLHTTRLNHAMRVTERINNLFFLRFGRFVINSTANGEVSK